MITPYEIYEAEQGRSYNPDVPFDIPFSLWMIECKKEYLTLFPDRAKNQIDGHFYSVELQRFFRWISERKYNGSRPI